jgi:hypothetical protein
MISWRKLEKDPLFGISLTSNLSYALYLTIVFFIGIASKLCSVYYKQLVKLYKQLRCAPEYTLLEEPVSFRYVPRESMRLSVSSIFSDAGVSKIKIFLFSTQVTATRTISYVIDIIMMIWIMSMDAIVLTIMVLSHAIAFVLFDLYFDNDL